MLADPFCWSALAVDGETAQAVITVSTVLYVEWGRLGEIGDLYVLPKHRRKGLARRLAPGCKTGEMAAKRWPHYSVLADMFDDVVVVGTPDDLRNFDGTEMKFPGHTRVLVGQLSLCETARVLAAAGTVVANDSGLGHIAGAVGTTTFLLFGPTPDASLGRLPPNVTVLRAGLPCEPCWFSNRFAPCAGRVDCLARLTVKNVAAAILGARGRPRCEIASKRDPT